MRELADAARIERFMRELGRAVEVDGRVYITGGATAVLHGWRESTIDVDIKLIPDRDEILREIPRLKQELDLNVELAAPSDFIPVPKGREGAQPPAGCTGFPHTAVRKSRTLCPVNPFNYQGPVDPAHLIDRRAELDSLQSAAADRVAIRLAAPRRFGKSSLLDAHIDAMRKAGHRAVRVDFSKVATLGDVAARVAGAYGELPADPARRVRSWAARLEVSGSVAGVRVGVGARPSRPPADEARAALLELLDVPLALHGADGELTVVCFDEFQEILVADDAVDGLIRSVIQHHGSAAAYVFAGSQPSLMHALFSEHERPFYGQARPLELPPLPIAEAARDIEELLTADGLDPSNAVDRLLAYTRGHPQRTILLAHHLYNVLEHGADDRDPTAAALELALAETRDAHQALWDGLGRNERLILLAIGDGQAPTGSTYAEEHRVARSTLREALERLLADQRHLQRDATGRLYLLDPLFAEWLRRR